MTSPRWAGAVAIALLVVAVPAPSSGQANTEVDAEVRLVDQTTWVDPDGEIVVRFRIDAMPPDATVEVTVHERLRSRDDFAHTLRRERLRGRLTDPPLRLGTVAEIGPNATARVAIRSGPQDPDGPPRLGIADAGVHPVDIAVYDADRTYLGGLVTHVVRLPAELDDDPLGVVVVQSLDAGLSHRFDGTIDIDQDTRTAWTLAVAALGDAPDQPVVIAPRPETVAALADGAAALDLQLLDDLASLTARHGVPASTYVALDVDGMVRAGSDAEIAHQFQLGHATLVDRLGARPDPTLWIAGADLTATALGALVDQGVERVILPRSALADPTSDPTADTDRDETGPDRDTGAAIDPDDPLIAPFRLVTPRGDRVLALSTDPLLQQHQGSSGDPLLDAQHALADLAMVWFDDPARARVVALELGADDDEPGFVAALRAGIAASPLLEATTTDDAFATATGILPRRQLRTAAGTSDRTGLRRDLDLARLSIASYHGVFPRPTDAPTGDDPDRRTDATFDQLLAVVVSPSLSQSERARFLGTIADTIDLALAGIDLPERRAITLAAREGTVPLTIGNNSGRTAVVAIRLDSDRLDFPEGERVEVELAVGVTTVDVPVRARASGAFPLEIELESPDGRIELGAARYTVRSTAVSGLGIAISVAAVLVLGVWWVRTARRARRSHASAAAARDTATGSAEA